MSISPPPLKRRRLEQAHVTSGLAIYSWNVNGIEPLLQTSIADFLKPIKAHGTSSDAPVAPIRDFLQRHAWPALCFLQEIKIPAGEEARLRAVRRAVSNRADTSLPSYQAHFCLPAKNRFATTRGAGRYYGVCTLVREDYMKNLVERVRTVAWDNEGRILIVETRGSKTEPKLAVINVYMVNGTDLPYRPVVGAEIQGTRHDRKLQVHALLQAECAQLEERGFAVIIAGDINVARTTLDGHPYLRTYPPQHIENRIDFELRFLSKARKDAVSAAALNSESCQAHSATLSTAQYSLHTDNATTHAAGDGQTLRITHDNLDEPAGAVSNTAPAQVTTVAASNRSLGMYDTFRTLHPQKRGYSYFSRAVDFGESCDRVDMIIASASIISSCVQAGMHETPADRASSDHVPIYAVFDWSSWPISTETGD